MEHTEAFISCAKEDIPDRLGDQVDVGKDIADLVAQACAAAGRRLRRMGDKLVGSDLYCFSLLFDGGHTPQTTTRTPPVQIQRHAQTR